MKLTLLLLLAELVLVMAVMAVGVLFLGKFMVQTAPEDIREIILARPDDPKWKTVLGVCLMILLGAALLMIPVCAIADARQNRMGFTAVFLRFLILLDCYKLFDMVVFDYFLLIKSNIFPRLFPETAGCKGYEKFGFNIKSQLIKLAVFTLLAATIAWAVVTV